jgi:hypothetical protein
MIVLCLTLARQQTNMSNERFRWWTGRERRMFPCPSLDGDDEAHGDEQNAEDVD